MYMIFRFTAKYSIPFILLLVCPMLFSCTNSSTPAFVNAASPNLEYMGRINYKDTTATFYWPGTSVQMNFEGTGASAVLNDENGQNYFYVVIDGKITTKLKTDKGYKSYRLIDGLSSGKHTVQLYKLTEARYGNTCFYGFKINDGGKILTKTAPKKRKIEFYGNSITSGYSLEDTMGDSNKPEYFNNYLTYASITARHFDAQYSFISKSGIGVMISWFPMIMPEMYDRLDPTDSTSKWDFSKYTPDIVVVNLLTNDLDLINNPKDGNFIARFGTKKPDDDFIIGSYKNFISSLRKKYPNASIICTLDAWKDPESDGHHWPGYITKAVALMNDPKIYTHFFDYKKHNKKGHPKAIDHQKMAESLISFIDGNITW